MSRDSISRYSPYSPPLNPNSNVPRSLWSASPGSGYDSLTLPPLDPDNEFNFDLEEAAQYFDTDPRLSTSDDPFLDEPEPSTSRSQEGQEQSQQSQANEILRRNSFDFDFDEISPDPFIDFQDFGDYTPPITPRPNLEADTVPYNTTGESAVVDLTEPSPQYDMPPNKKRKATAPSEGRAAKAARGTAKIRSSRASPAKAKIEEADVVDLVDIEDDLQYEDFKKKQQAELIKQQQQDEANKPVKLAEFQCIICMDNPTDLTVTHCGMYFGFRVKELC